MTDDSPQLLLQTLSADALREAIGEEELASVRSIAGVESKLDEESPERLAQLLLVFRGEQILEDPQIRMRILGLLPADDLERLANELTGRGFSKPADNTLALASLPWRSSAPIVMLFAQRFKVPPRYLPKATTVTPTASSIRPFRALPPLRDYQEEVRVRVLQLLKQGNLRVLVQMPTGAGKTRTMMEILTSIAIDEGVFAQGSVLWLAHVEELCDQALTAFEEVWLNRGDTVVSLTRAWGQHKPSLDDYVGAFIVGTYQKFIALRKSNPAELDEIRQRLALVVVDEAHKVIAPTFRSLLDEITKDDVKIVGLTATPGRGLESSGENAQLAGFFGKNLVTPGWSRNPIADLRKRHVLARVRHWSIDSGVKITLSSSERSAAVNADLPPTALVRLAASIERNRRIVNTLVQEVTAGRACLIFACTVDHSRMLAAALNLRGCPAAHIDSSLARSHRKDLIAAFRNGQIQVLSNFGVLSTGFDAPRVSTVVVARPTTSVVLYSQMIGRGLRGPASGGSPECNLIDVRDNFTSFGGVDDVYAAFAPYWED